MERLVTHFHHNIINLPMTFSKISSVAVGKIGELKSRKNDLMSPAAWWGVMIE